MYIPNSYAERDLPTLFAFLEAHSLAAIVTSTAAAGLFATHLPLVLHRSIGEIGTLRGHFARANPHFRQLVDSGGTAEALVIFSGPDAYITPGWYPTKTETARVVPTWNYVAVHVRGTLHLRDDTAFLREHLEELTSRHESQREKPWHVSDAPEEYIAQQMKAIIGAELAIASIDGKWKMSQNRSAADIDGVIAGLASSAHAAEHVVAAIVAERRPDPVTKGAREA